MRPGESDELLSAYLDREVTPSERERVESQLDASPDARAELDALAELSLCLRTFDRPEAPADLKSSIMQALAGRRIEAAPAAPPARRLRREWNIMTIAAMATAACGLYIAVSGWDSMNVSSRTSSSITATDAFDPTMPTSLDDVVSEPERMHRRDAAGDGLVRYSAATLPTTLEARGDLQPPSPASSAAMAAPIVAAPKSATTYFDGANVLAESAPEAGESALDKVALNDFLLTWAATDAPDRYVANIGLQVLDVRRTADGLQALLLDNGVMQAVEDNSRKQKASGPGKMAGDAPAAKEAIDEHLENEGMIAVYVDTTADRFTKSLEEFSQKYKYEVVGVRLQQPLALAREIEDEVAPDEAKTPQIAEKLQQRMTTPEDVKNEYVLQQLANNLELAEIDGPVDALAVLGIDKADSSRPRSGGDRELPESRLTDSTTEIRAAKLLTNRKSAPNADAKDRGLPIVSNYCSEVRLPLVTGFELAENINNNGIMPLEKKSNTLSLSTLDQNSVGRNSPLTNPLPITSGLSYNRARQYGNNSATPTVRVLVVFENAPQPAKAGLAP